MKQNIFAIGIIAVLFTGLGLYVGAKHGASDSATPAHGTPAAVLSPVAALYAQSLPDTAGQLQSLAQWRGKPLIINFWATWCHPCVQEMPALTALQTEVAPRGIQFIGIGIDSAPHIAEFATQYKIGYPLYVAGVSGTELSRQLGNDTGGLPYTVLIGRDGKIKKTYLGLLKLSEFRADLAAL
jgi:thiol-disulfide isomerase/thioredoxin